MFLEVFITAAISAWSCQTVYLCSMDSSTSAVSRAAEYNCETVSYYLHFYYYLLYVCVCQVCEAVAAAAGAAFHRPQVSRTLVLFQAHRGHAHRHLPHGDAGGAPSNDVKISHPPVARGDQGEASPSSLTRLIMWRYTLEIGSASRSLQSVSRNAAVGSFFFIPCIKI